MTNQHRLQTVHRLFHTVRHLRVRQIIFQLWYRVYRGAIPPVPQYNLRQQETVKHWINKPACWEPGLAFTFLNERRVYQPNVQWEDPDASKLWLYNLHYFDCLSATDTRATDDHTERQASFEHMQYHRDALINDWIANNQSIAGNAWEPYPTSLRIVNWIKWHSVNRGLSEEALNSLAQQSAWLSSRLEYHILANHLFANAKAMVFAGLFFSGEQADAWLAKGVDLVTSELAEQILADGAHFELSPMYHAILLEDVLDMINLANAIQNVIPDNVLDGWSRYAVRMLRWQRQMLHPDQDIAFFNDAALGIARTPTEIEDYAASLGLAVEKPESQSAHLAASGYAVLKKGFFTVIADVAPVGPSYQPGHAHADTLSCECSVGQERVFVNAGTSIYAKGELRDWQRSTAAHNTVEIAGLNSSDVWGGFRVARRAYPRNVRWTNDELHIQLKASHNGYRSLRGHLTHVREWQLDNQGLCVTDLTRCRSENDDSKQYCVTARWLLHPAVQVTGSHMLKTSSGILLKWQVTGGDATLQSAFWYPEFGKQQPTQCIVINSSVGKVLSIRLSVISAE